ncbi:EF-hand calcium-binding domain-containing protein 4B-like isoform X3 [Convolutriloba macropyga]|uniref:EF-hand calcium-binding domain-containing protein 4B-like isoform X3 n=1 Tax=Convolutriloba macropyga TaxID=536237 RepID=UPI003F5236C0
MHEEILCQDPAVDTQNLLREKAVELFGICDKECKGFITRRDLLRLTHELPLTADVLEEVFDRLDDDGNGYLSFEEFTDGFGQFLSYVEGHEDDDPAEVAKQQKKQSVASQGGGSNPTEGEDGTEQFEQLLYQLNGHEIVRDPHSLKQIWVKLRTTDPNSVTLFEEFLAKMVRDMRKTVSEQRELEEALKTRSVLHDEELTKLYEEMETQIELERQRAKRQEQEREQKMRDDMIEELQQKERQLQELISKKNSLAEQVKRLQGEESSVRLENDQLLRKNEELEEAVRKLDSSYHDTQHYLKTIKDQMNQEKRERARAALKVNESIAKERSTLVQQLDELREENKQLKDERDELVTFKASVGMIENLLKQVQDKGTIEVSSEEEEEEEEEDETTNDISDIHSLTGNDEENDTLSESEEVKNDVIIPSSIAALDAAPLEDKKADGSQNTTDQTRDSGNGTCTPVSIKTSHVGEYGSENAEALSGSREKSEEVSEEAAKSEEKTKSMAAVATGVSKRRRSLSLKRAEGTTKQYEKGKKKHRSRHASKNKEKLSGGSGGVGGGGVMSVGGDLEKSKSISVEKFSNNLSALLSSNQLDIASLQLPTNNQLQGGRRGSVIANYIPPGAEDSKAEGQSSDEDVVDYYEEGALDREGMQRSARQLFLQDDASSINWDRRDSHRSMETINLNSTFDVNKLGVTGQSFEEEEVVESEVEIDVMGQGLMCEATPCESQFQDLQTDKVVDITRHRVFKVVFVGDSGVGKSSYISRVCRDQFSDSLPATVGVDYHVKQLILDSVCYSLQFWDTAGQERYRSITKQYFRRTDAIVVMYDVTSERSLLNVRQWVEEIREEIDEDILLFLLGSKNDLKADQDEAGGGDAGQSGSDPIDDTEGKFVAERCGAFFMEVSSRSGEGIADSVQLIAQELAKLEDKDLENAKNIVLKNKKKQKSGCC